MCRLWAQRQKQIELEGKKDGALSGAISSLTHGIDFSMIPAPLGKAFVHVADQSSHCYFCFIIFFCVLFVGKQHQTDLIVVVVMVVVLILMLMLFADDDLSDDDTTVDQENE